MTKKKILIADDDPNISLSLNFLMAREGFEVLLARDGETALRTVRDEQPDLVLLDVMMPDKSGLEVCEALRSDPETRSLPVLMVSARGDEVAVETGLALGANGYIAKPFSTRELVERVRSLLETDG